MVDTTYIYTYVGNKKGKGAYVFPFNQRLISQGEEGYRKHFITM